MSVLERIAVIDSEHGLVTVLRNNSTGSVRYDQDFCSHSEADVNGVSLAPYIHAIYGLLMQTCRRTVLIIGCGGGSLATMLRGANFAVTLVDVNPWSFQIARDHFHLPGDIECHVGDGSEYVRHCGRFYDAIVLDAYQSGEIPEQFLSSRFLAAVASRLSEADGCFFANICLDDLTSRAADRFAVALGRHLPNVRILDSLMFFQCNAVVMAGQVAELKRPELLLPPSHDAERISLELDQLAFRNLAT